MHPISSSACAILLFLALALPPPATAQINFAREPWEPPINAYERSVDRSLYGGTTHRKNSIYPERGRKDVAKKLQSIRIDEFHIPEPTKLPDVVKRLHALARQSDPDKAGVNLILASRVNRSNLIPGIDPATETQPLAIADYEVTISPPLRDVTLHGLLEAIVDLAKPPKGFENAPRLSYSVGDYAVLLWLRTFDREPLYTRTFKVDPNTFIQGLNLDFQPDPLQPATDPLRGFRVQEAVRDYFQRAGLNFSTNQIPAVPGIPAPPQKAVFFNDRTGTLMIRATLNDLQIVEKALQTLGATPRN